MKKINLPLTRDIIKTLKVGEEVLLTGPVLTARDAAHKRLVNTLESKGKIPVSIKGETIYYTGPTPARPGEIIGSCGPTTSFRMDPFSLVLLKNGLLGMIGKGERSYEVTSMIKRFGAVYFVTIGGAGAYLSQKIKGNTVLAYKDLGTEAIHRLIIEDFPAIVSIK
ncbi:MAG: FumA C-terminus/TtdB family hydratase beta subunit [Candidatus Omnitrophica bacterium]|nr:FumA C-terminus/TtdB family hydratase beta subunit [Candidatus Omnitrophota bacterium]MBU1852744.1 FumA C-terminus/TtdB family hydratase beta subunit [Candidatus Omnitrophota bacterium]